MQPDVNIDTSHHHGHTQNIRDKLSSEQAKLGINISPIRKTDSTDSGRFFHFGTFDIGPLIEPEDTQIRAAGSAEEFGNTTDTGDEARYNLATRVMSNGVEVIIAGDKNAKPSLKPNILRILPSLTQKPLTLAPSTLKDQMVLVMPSNLQENYTIPINSNYFITKTCLTTYTYRTTYLQEDGATTIESREKIVTNTATEERNYFKIKPTEAVSVTLSRTPELAVGVFYTTYTYYNTIYDGDLPLVMSSQHTLTNTITGPDDYISYLQPSEEATPVLETHTYLSRIVLTKTKKESEIEKIISTSNVLTQVIVTESLPPRSTNIITTYTNFEPEEDTKTESSLDPKPKPKPAAVIDSNKRPQAKPHRNITVSTLQGIQDKLLSYLKNDLKVTKTKKKTELETNVASNASSVADMHIYATKTFLTTFSYFTTLKNSLGNSASPTVVSYHTRVIENVITESIPSFLIDSDVLVKFATELKNTKNHNSYITTVTLPVGHPLEVTAMYILPPTPTATDQVQVTQSPGVLEKDASIKAESSLLPTSTSNIITPPAIETSNEVLEPEVASSENEEQIEDHYVAAESVPAPVIQNHTKIANTGEFPSVNQLIESLNFNRLQALGPVFNAMADLLQTNFGAGSTKNGTLTSGESKHSAKNISAIDGSQGHGGPIYIPVQNVPAKTPYEGYEHLKTIGNIIPQSLHIASPETDWLLDHNKSHVPTDPNPGKPTYETPLLNGGIPISPGEVITANSDVIVGKPNGIQPLVPDSGNNAILQPPPLAPISYQLQYQQFPKQIKLAPNPIPLDPSYDKQINFDGILKPPPRSPLPMQYQPHNMKKLSLHGFPSTNRVPFAAGHLYQIQQSHSQQQHHIPVQRIPLQVPHHLQHPSFVRPPHNLDYPANSKNPPTHLQKPNYIPYTPHDYDQQPTPPKPNEFDRTKDLRNNEILEIQRIPEVYSTDLPATESNRIAATNVLGNTTYKTLIKKVIGSDKPMLVNIQPSQITNIVIPRDNAASILVVESAVELHKNDQYYNEPTTYPNAIVTGSVSQGRPARKPILSNQQVNLDTNVLSHNVDINVPPITFNKDTDFPHSTPVRGHIQKPDPTKFLMPHVTIPITDSDIQVNLTSQNMVTQTFPGPSYNEKTIQKPLLPFLENQPGLPFYTEFDRKPKPPGRHPIPISGDLSIPQFVGLPGNPKFTGNQLPFTIRQKFSPKYPTRPPQETRLHIFSTNKTVNYSPPTQPPTYSEEDLSGEFSQRPQSTVIRKDDDVKYKQNANEDQKTAHSVNVQQSAHKKLADTGSNRTNSTRSTNARPIPIPSTSAKQQSAAITKSPTKPPARHNISLGLIGKQSFLDPASVKAVNNMGELYEIQRPVPPQPHPGRPFTKIKSNTKPPEQVKTQNILINVGEGFKLQREPQNSSAHDRLGPNQIETASRKIISILPPSTTPTTPSIELNKMETLHHTNITAPNANDSGEIFNTFESANPHNFNFVNNRKPVSTPNTTVHPSVTQPPVNMKPPMPQTENVLGLLPPLPPNGHTHTPIKAINPPSTTTPSSIRPTYSTHKFTSTLRSKTKKTHSKAALSTKPKPPQKTDNPSIPITSEATISIAPTKVANTSTISPTKTANRPHTPVTPMQLPPSNTQFGGNDIYIESSETDLAYQASSNQIATETPPATSTTQFQPPPKHVTARTRIKSRIIIPTKYITNTQILTVTTTKTSVLTSLGIPSTQIFTLTKTKTSTLIDTVTETHTLLQPTQIIQLDTTTTTQIIHSPYPLPSLFDDRDSTSPTSPPSSPPPPTAPPTTNSSLDVDNNSIFVVMSDKKNHGGIFSINPSIIADTDEATHNENSIELDYDDNITFDLPARDEEGEVNEVNHVLLGGVLIATPPRVKDTEYGLGAASATCRPSCKASRNEICQYIDNQMMCVCRPGFARMFPDRPCRPTYTYAMQIPIYRVSKQALHFKDQYHLTESGEFKQLEDVLHHAVDRMVMQSDLRDVYHGVHVASFDATKSGDGILGNFLIQLSDNSDGKRLVDVFKKYLRQNNFSLGGTDVFTTKSGVDSLLIADFDECAHSQFHDCSESSRCFNLQGTYTCSCQEGYADLSENTIYPGRICSAELIGCEKCHYHGKCIQVEKDIPPVCECFHWYAGASCQLNLKILLIALIAIGTILFMLLLFCILVTCIRQRRNNNIHSLMSGMHIIPPANSRLSNKSLTIDKRAMIKDSSSEASHNSTPYALKKETRKHSHIKTKAPQQQQQPMSYGNINQRVRSSSALSDIDHRVNYSEQNDRSLTVMIPRAKYHHAILAHPPPPPPEPFDQPSHDYDPSTKGHNPDFESKASTFRRNSERVMQQSHRTRGAIGQDSRVSFDKLQSQHVCGKGILNGNSSRGPMRSTSTGALVSAGFEVSATVGNVLGSNPSVSKSSSHTPKPSTDRQSRRSTYSTQHLQYNTYKEGDKFIDSMDAWLDTIQQNELAAEVRSFDETTIQAPTKSLRSIYERQLSQSNINDDAHTMAERDIGSTFLLPHTHLYKPDRDSDMSGFDSF